MKGKVCAALLAGTLLAGYARAEEPPGPEARSTTMPPAETETTAGAGDSGKAAAPAKDHPAPPTRTVAPPVTLKFTGLQERLARRSYRRKAPDLLSREGPPAVLTDRFGLMVDRNFGK